MKPHLVILVALFFSGCSHVPPGGVKKAHVTFGVPMVFHVHKTITGAKVTDGNIIVGDTQTKVTIGPFAWDSAAEGVVLTNPPAKP